MLSYRTNGAWGVGTGSDLPAADIDRNVHRLVVATDRLDNSPPVPTNGIADIRLVQSDILVHLQNGATLGPFTIPSPEYVWRGDWEAEEEYDAFDVFHVDGEGIFLALADHTSGTEFDPDASTVHRVFGPLGDEVTVSPVITVDAVETTVSSEEDGWYVRCLNGATLRVLTDAAADWIDGSNFTIRQVGDDPVVLTSSPGVDIVVPPGRMPATGKRGAVVHVKRIAPNTWDIRGDLAPSED